MTKAEILNKIESIYSDSKLSEIEALDRFLRRKEKEEETKNSIVIWCFAILGVVLVVGIVAVIVYNYLKPDYLEDFEDDFDDDFDDFDDEFFEKDDDDLVSFKKSED
ncbi:MAG: hypothetical protein IJ058_06625 [Lachnospiraceae bacterium]|nr:hypothetical protein [Lachnospiraceae bacterium]